MERVLQHAWAAALCAAWLISGPASAAETPSPAWPLTAPARGEALGSGPTGARTTVTVTCPRAVTGAPVIFGIPLARVTSTEQVRLTDERGQVVPADCFPLGRWQGQPAPWALVACVVDAPTDGTVRRLTLESAPGVSAALPATPATGSVSPSAPVRCVISGGRAVLGNGLVELELSGAGLAGLRVGGKSIPCQGGGAAFIPHGQPRLAPTAGAVTVLYDGQVYKRVRFTSPLSEALDLQQEYELWAGSPSVRCTTRFINRTLHDLPLDGLIPLELTAPAAQRVVVGMAEGRPVAARRFCLHQRAFGWTADVDGTMAALQGEQDNLGEWVALELAPPGTAAPGPRLMVVCPTFQEMAAGDDDLESTLTFADGTLRLTHYLRLSDTADVRLRETMARTFVSWLVADPPAGKEAAIAAAIKALPHVGYDREYLTRMGVFQEPTVSHLFDREVTEGARYFLRAAVSRPEYPRCERGVDPGPDKSGEGAYEINLHGGGMVSGEVFQYFTPHPGGGTFKFFGDLGVDRKHILTGGTQAYRNGDIPLALFQQYLRTGDRALGEFAQTHALLYADYGISHARGDSAGVGHYYCDWYGNPYVYQRFEGLLLGYLVSGEPWLWESAQAMADFCVRNWRDGHPQDGTMAGKPAGVQTRSAYIAKMLLLIYDLTGDRRYADTVVRLAEWAAKWQDPEGWWTMHPGTGREFRCTPIFAGYVCQGLWPVYWRSKHPGLLSMLLKASEWYLSKQEDARGSNPGTFPNSYWYGKFMQAGAPIRGNYATSSHAANILLQTYLATHRQEFFYAANAAWVGVLNHQTPEGGTPLENDATGSVWSHVMVESLPHLGAVAETEKLPLVLSSRTGVPGTSFMGKGASYDGKTFTCELKCRHKQPVVVTIFWPGDKPGSLRVDGAETPFEHEAPRHVVRLTLPAATDFRVCKVEVSAQ